MARCPVHPDREASLSVDPGTKVDGAVLHCFAGCDTDEILAAMGLTARDLYTDQEPARPAPTVGRNGHAGPRPRTIVKKTRWLIPGPNDPVATHIRLDYDDGSKGVVWELPDGRSGLNGRAVVSLPLYRSDRLTECTRNVVITEGEKACDALAGILDDPTTAVLGTVTGASAIPHDCVLATLVGLDSVVLWPDNDQAGEDHMRRIAGRLVAQGQPADTVLRVEWQEAPAKGDAADFVAAGNEAETAWELLGIATPYPLIHPPHQNQRTDETDSIDSVSFDSAQNEEEPWLPHQALPPEAPPVPTMPAALLPDALCDWLVGVADRSCVPVEMVAVPAVIGAGAVIGREVGIRPGRYDDFVTVPNLWGAIVARPGTLKTDLINQALRPLGKLVAKARETYQTAAETAAVDAEVLDAEIDAIKKGMKDAASSKKPADEKPSLDELKKQLIAKREARSHAVAKAKERRYITHDPTTEKLGELLRDNPRGLLHYRDELIGWLRGLERPGREGDREFYLEAWNGTGSFTTDRIGRGTIHIPALCLSVCGGIQPGKLRPLVTDALDGGAGDDGLLQRLQLLVWPDRLPPWRKPEGWPAPEARQRADRVYEWLDRLTPSLVQAKTDGDIPYLTFTPSAQSIADIWRDELEHRLRSGALDDTPAFASHLAKYRSLMPALALTFELIALADREHTATGTVGEPAVRLAASWCEFLECHARKLYAAEIEGGVSAAHLLAAKIEAGAINDGESIREIYRAGWSGLKSPDRVLLGMQVLADAGWARLTKEGERRPSQIVRLHPDFRTPAKKNAGKDADHD